MISPIIKLDLLDPDQFRLVLDLVRNPFCLYVHLAPPCGTSSRARDIQRPGEQLPPPARSGEFPNGLPSLQGILKERVLKANLLYERTGAIFAECILLNKMVSVENPANSYFWKTLGWVSQTQGLAFQEVVFHNCQHGGQRAKATRLAHNIDLFSELHLMCPGESQGHQHLPWSRDGKAVATSEEKVYPWTLCRRIADIILRTLLQKGFQAAPDSMQPGASAQHVEAAAATNTQPRGKKLPPLVPEFAQIITITCSEPLFPGITKVEVKTDLPDNADCSIPITSLPAGSRILRQDIVGVVPATEDSSCEHVASNPCSDAALTRVMTTRVVPHPQRMIRSVIASVPKHLHPTSLKADPMSQ